MLRVSRTARYNGPGRPVPSHGPKGSRACPGRSDRRGHEPMSDGQGGNPGPVDRPENVAVCGWSRGSWGSTGGHDDIGRDSRTARGEIFRGGEYLGRGSVGGGAGNAEGTTDSGADLR